MTTTVIVRFIWIDWRQGHLDRPQKYWKTLSNLIPNQVINVDKPEFLMLEWQNCHKFDQKLTLIFEYSFCSKFFRTFNKILAEKHFLRKAIVHAFFDKFGKFWWEKWVYNFCLLCNCQISCERPECWMNDFPSSPEIWTENNNAENCLPKNNCLRKFYLPNRTQKNFQISLLQLLLSLANITHYSFKSLPFIIPMFSEH